MKADDEFFHAWADGHMGTEATAYHLREMGLDVEVTPPTFRSHVSEADGWNHDIDLYVEGEPYQHKQSKRYPWGVRPSPIVDERVKADRTPVRAYIQAFNCGTRMVAPYDPTSWTVTRFYDAPDDAWKEYYLCPKRQWRSLEEWFFGQGGLF